MHRGYPACVEDPAIVPEAARRAILDWFDVYGRLLAFRRTTDPYAVLVSEAMAQQTQAARAAARWERFIARFPSVDSLAGATPADVLREWQGLGYDRRGLALWRAAVAIRDRHGGRVPDSLDALEALPGVGPYTARAVLAIAYGRPVGAVDVNVHRVLGRLVAGAADAMPARALQSVADRAVPLDRPAAWTHALMDLGATVCRPRAPRCDGCPVRAWCRYAAVAPSAPPLAPAPRRREPSPPFPATTRWLRGRILDRLRAAPGDAWVELDRPIGDHDLRSVRTAAVAMGGEGLVELDDRRPSGEVRARLSTT
jgi:A/G-specific adenine glycosylase